MSTFITINHKRWKFELRPKGGLLRFHSRIQKWRGNDSVQMCKADTTDSHRFKAVAAGNFPEYWLESSTYIHFDFMGFCTKQFWGPPEVSSMTFFLWICSANRNTEVMQSGSWYTSVISVQDTTKTRCKMAWPKLCLLRVFFYVNNAVGMETCFVPLLEAKG